MKISLCSLNEGETATVEMISLSGDIHRRLKHLGLIKGTKIECLHKSPAGNPIAYLIRGAVIAIRNEDAEKISVLSER